MQKSLDVLQKFHKINKKEECGHDEHVPVLLQDEDELLNMAHAIDLLVIASPNHLHADTIRRWGHWEHLTILCEKPIAVSQQQHDDLLNYYNSPSNGLKARVWIAMEYRYIPAIAKLLSLLHTVGDLKMVTIRENRVSHDRYDICMAHFENR